MVFAAHIVKKTHRDYRAIDEVHVAVSNYPALRVEKGRGELTTASIGRFILDVEPTVLDAATHGGLETAPALDPTVIDFDKLVVLFHSRSPWLADGGIAKVGCSAILVVPTIPKATLKTFLQSAHLVLDLM